MPSRCCVPLCKGNYPSGPKVSIYSFPKDEGLKQRWLQVIQRKDFHPTKYSRICELHFKDFDFDTNLSGQNEKTGEIITVPLKIRRLKQSAVPSVFHHYPPSNLSQISSSRLLTEERKAAKDMKNFEIALSASKQSFIDYVEARKIITLNDALQCIKKFGISNFWTVYEAPNVKCLCLVHIEINPEPFIQFSVTIDENLNLFFSVERNRMEKLDKLFFPIRVSNFNDIVNILDMVEKNYEPQDKCSKINYVIGMVNILLESVSSEGNESIIRFIREQLTLLLSQSNNFRYSSEFLIFACILKTISPHAYKYIRQTGILTMPHPDTLKKICNNLNVSPQLELQDENFLMYIANRTTYLKEYEKTVILMLDEIHIKPFFDYKGGPVVGAAFDCNKPATSVFVFMISSVLSSFKEVVHCMPVNHINYEKLHSVIKKVILGLEDLGYKVICLVTDNAINKSALSLFVNPPQKLFVYPHPVDKERPLFFLIDSVHLFKNIRNNWLNQKNKEKCFYYPDFANPSHGMYSTASFLSLKKLHEIENNEIVKYARGLTLKSLTPSNLERQNVKLVLNIFNKFVCLGLRELGPVNDIPHFEETAYFIDLICKWWNIFNVKTPNKGIHQRDVFMEPLKANESDEKYIFLNKFLDWLNFWDRRKYTTGVLSKETLAALSQTTHGMMELSKYCINELNMKYILTGKIQTDSLEARFGQYRQMAGSQYHISLRQLLECEKKLRLQSCIKLELPIKSQKVKLIDFDVTDAPNDISLSKHELKDFPPVIIDNAVLSSMQPYLPILTYLGGYCCYSVLKKLKCLYCKENLILDSDINLDETYNLIKNLDKGGLKCPTQFVVTIVLYNYIVVNSLYSNSESFLCRHNLRHSVVMMTFNILKSQEIELEDNCLNGHETDDICKQILWTSTNIMLKNLCLKENDLLRNKNENKKRKIETLKK